VPKLPHLALDDRLRLVLLSFLMLFVELALIRWIGSNVIYLSYFSNFVLLGSFLGIGIGFLRAGGRTGLFQWAPISLALLVGFVLSAPVEINRGDSDLIYFGAFQPQGLPIWLVLPVIFVSVAVVMAMIAEGVATTFRRFPPLDAYRLDIVGSILGTLAFSALAFLWAPPVVWGAVAGLLLLLLVRGGWPVLRFAAILGLVIMLGRESFTAGFGWSPYYQVHIDPDPDVALTHVSVNGVPYQGFSSVKLRRQIEPFYFLPYERLGAERPGRVLIIGAGTGTDVAIALEQGAETVDAVEIDPKLLQIGVEQHPDQPYGDPRVTAYVEDGRAFLEQTDATYDLILFALPDSLTLVAGQSSLRLESYLFTAEALAAARERLAPGGSFAMYNYYRENWLIDRFAATVQATFGTSPCLDSVGEAGKLAMLMVERGSPSLNCPQRWTALDPPTAAPATDDHPFPYLREASVPLLYLVTIGLILLASLVMVRVVGGPLRTMGGYGDLFLMGAAFLLLETKGVVQFALLFGTTWFVNALVFAGVLACVLAAIEVARRVSLPPVLLYVALLGAVLVSWAVPGGALLDLAFPARLLAAVGLWFTPIFLANLIFAARFREVGDSTAAFGANLLGAMVGGLLEYAALVTGYANLALLVGVLYGLAFVVWRLGSSAGWRMARRSVSRSASSME
jgi:SAM-dependent methyltransferase